jgi:hypothetical protein
MIACPYDCITMKSKKNGHEQPGFIAPGASWNLPSWEIISRNPCSGHLLMRVRPDEEYITITWACSSSISHKIQSPVSIPPLPIEASNLENFLNDHFGLTTETNPEPKTPLLKNLWEGIHID